MNPKAAILATTIFIAAGNLNNVAAQGWASVASQLPIDKLTAQIGQMGDYFIRLIQGHFDQQRADSIGQLVIDLTNLAGSEEALATVIDALAKNPQDAYHRSGVPGSGAVMDSLNNNLNLVRQQFMKVNADINSIDKQWAQKNAALQADIGSFAHDGALFYCIQDCGTNFYTGQPAIHLTDPQQADQLAAVLRSDVDKVRKIAASIQSANIQSEAKK